MLYVCLSFCSPLLAVFLIASSLLMVLAGVLALLDDPEEDVKVFALSKLDELVDNFWPEISEFVSKM